MLPLLLLLASLQPAEAESGYRVGIGRQIITPTEPLWMSGYASRNKPCDTKHHDLWVKAIALEDPKGNKAVLLTSDLCGIPRSLSEEVCREVMKQSGLKREQIILSCSHTHSGPVVLDNLNDMYEMPADQQAKIQAYTERLKKQMIEIMVIAVKTLKPAKVSLGEGTARFAVNRREATKKGIINGNNPQGPVDHSVPVLKVTDEKGKVQAILFGYACHNTTMAFYEWCGDYAGFAQIELEKKYPDATALFWTGCGADANPLPRGKIELCEKYGKELAIAVSEVVEGKTQSLTSPLTAKYAEIALAFDQIPEKEAWKADLKSTSFAQRKRAEKNLMLLAQNKPIPKRYSQYPIQVWRFGDQLTWVALGGEVVIDYNLRLKKELSAKGFTWIAGYANDVMAYIPSERVLKEGGYEADSSQIYYGMPTKWAPGLEEAIVQKALELAK